MSGLTDDELYEQQIQQAKMDEELRQKKLRDLMLQEQMRKEQQPTLRDLINVFRPQPQFNTNTIGIRG